MGSKMRINLELKRDSDNSHPDGYLEMQRVGKSISLQVRVVEVDCRDLFESLKILSVDGYDHDKLSRLKKASEDLLLAVDTERELKGLGVYPLAEKLREALN